MKTDNEIQKEILQELQSDSFVSPFATEVGVIVKNGAVSLCGQLSSYERKDAVLRTVKKVTGVKVISVNIEVLQPGAPTHTCIDTGRAVQRVLNWHLATEEKSVEAKVEGDWVYLNGELGTKEKMLSIENAIEKLPGVKGIVNMIRVKAVALPEFTNDFVKEMVNAGGMEIKFPVKELIPWVIKNGRAQGKCEVSETHKVKNPSNLYHKYGYCGLKGVVVRRPGNKGFRKSY